MCVVVVVVVSNAPITGSRAPPDSPLERLTFATHEKKWKMDDDFAECTLYCV